jgi:hypothetical protein
MATLRSFPGEDRPNEWQVPAFEADPARRQDWVETQVQDGEQWWNSQKASDAEKYLDLLSSAGPEQAIKSNTLKSDIRKFVETISDIREIGTFGTGAEQFQKTAEMFNKVVKNIYRVSHFPRQARKALQWSVGLSRGYIWPRYSRTDFGWGPGLVEFMDLGPREVMPTQVPKSGDIQGCYAVTIIECLGIAEAHARFPHAQEKLQPISKFRYTSPNQVRRHEFWDRHRYGTNTQNWENQFCEIRHTFIRDLRVNRTGKMLPMGDYDTSWYYEVPSVGAVISWRDPNNNLPASKQADVVDCRLYPHLRRIITNPGMEYPLYDGPDFEWHGIIPAVQYDVDDWPWLAVGYSLLQDVAGLERGKRAFLDLMYRVLKVKMKPPMGYDLSSGVAREDIKRLDLLDPDIESIGIDGDPRKALQSILPDSVKVDPEDFKLLEVLEKFQGKTLGLNDLGSLAQLKFNLSSETADKLLETIGPIAKGISGNLEISHAKICQMLKFIICQHFTTRQLLSDIGPEGVATKVFDFNPNSIVPSHMPWETNQEAPSQSSNQERARWFAQNLQLISVPSSLIDITQMQERLMWLNFLQRGFPVSFSTAFKKLGIEDWGESPGETEFARWEYEQVRMVGVKTKLAQLAALEGGGAPAGGGGGGGKGQGKGGGRPPTAQAPPKLEQRGNGQRAVVSQSK